MQDLGSSTTYGVKIAALSDSADISQAMAFYHYGSLSVPDTETSISGGVAKYLRDINIKATSSIIRPLQSVSSMAGSIPVMTTQPQSIGGTQYYRVAFLQKPAVPLQGVSYMLSVDANGPTSANKYTGLTWAQSNRQEEQILNIMGVY